MKKTVKTLFVSTALCFVIMLSNYDVLNAAPKGCWLCDEESDCYWLEGAIGGGWTHRDCHSFLVDNKKYCYTDSGCHD